MLTISFSVTQKIDQDHQTMDHVAQVHSPEKTNDLLTEKEGTLGRTVHLHVIMARVEIIKDHLAIDKKYVVLQIVDNHHHRTLVRLLSIHQAADIHLPTAIRNEGHLLHLRQAAIINPIYHP